MSILSMDGKAAVVLPDNVLFEAGNAGEGLRKRLVGLLRLSLLCFGCPQAFSTSRGSKRTCSFSTRSQRLKILGTKKLWIYDLRTNKHFTLVQNQLSRKDLDEFVSCYCPENRNARAESAF
jgi:type I restriction enzyme M protein